MLKPRMSTSADTDMTIGLVVLWSARSGPVRPGSYFLAAIVSVR